MTERRYDLDWLRIIAFGLLIFYHIGMFYVSWDWHVKSSRASDAIEPLMMLTSPWRLTLLFLISGAATRFMADKMSAWNFTASRMGRLWPPLLLAVLVIVPPQAYYEVIEAMGEPGAPAALNVDNFYWRYVTASGGWCDSDGCLTTPTYNHMWFVAYLILYSLALVPLLPLLRRIPASVARLITGPGLFLAPWLVMWALRATLFPIFGESHDFREDWYLHALYLATFLFGFAIAKHQPFFDRCTRWRGLALAIALASWAVIQGLYASYSEQAPPPEGIRFLARGVREAQAWCAIIAAIGFAHSYLKNADGPIRRLLTQAIFPFYLIHQTIIVVAAHHLNQLRWPLPLEVATLVTLTLLGCWLFFDLGRRIPILRPWIGLASPSRRAAANVEAPDGEVSQT